MKEKFLLEVDFLGDPQINITKGETWSDYITGAVYFLKEGIVRQIPGKNKMLFDTEYAAKNKGILLLKEESARMQRKLESVQSLLNELCL